MDRRRRDCARRFFDRLEPVHAVTYFAPEARTALDGLWFRGFWMGYFAARSAPFGVVPTEMVTAAFYNFAPQRVAKALPAAWEFASPAERAFCVLARNRRWPRCAVVASATTTMYAPPRTWRQKWPEAPPLDGRPLFAANVALDWPDEPVAKLWQP